jgi:yecA family protein
MENELPLVARSAYSKSRTVVDPVLPPELRRLGALPFASQHRETLRSWLSETGWPRDSMDMEMLEGYLIALLVWPIDLPPGAWLPPIWGESGWKVPAKLADPTALGRFVALIGGFLQQLDRELTQTPHFAAAVRLPESRMRGQPPARCDWALGFLSALKQHSDGLKYRTSTVKAASAVIAYCASMPATRSTGFELSQAVLLLAAERSSRGPLGPLTNPVRHVGTAP